MRRNCSVNKFWRFRREIYLIISVQIGEHSPVEMDGYIMELPKAFHKESRWLVGITIKSGITFTNMVKK